MTSEQFHDALTLLSEDLIAQADAVRFRKPRRIPWKQYAAVAACFAVLLCSAGVYRNAQPKTAITEMADAAPYTAMQGEAADAEAAPRMEAAPAPEEDAAAVDATARVEAVKGAPESAASNAMEDGGVKFTCVETPVNTHSTVSYAHGPSATGITSRGELDDYLSKWDKLYMLDTLRDACGSYDEDWFTSHDLLLIPVDCVTGPCTVTNLEISDGICQVIIDIGSEETDQQTNYHILLPMEKNAVTNPGNITIIYNSDTTD